MEVNEILMEVQSYDIITLVEKIEGADGNAKETDEALPISGVRRTHGFFLLSGAPETGLPTI